MLYQLSKLIHVAGFILGIGVMLSTTVAFKHFWALYDTNKAQGIAAFKAFGNVQKFGMIGLLLVLAGGIGMFALADSAFWDLLWFRIKMALVVLMLVNGFTFGRTSTLALQSFLKSESTDANRARELQSKVRMFQLLQISIFAAIILLSVFRFAGAE
jgi:hypothetical protein